MSNKMEKYDCFVVKSPYYTQLQKKPTTHMYLPLLKM